MILDAIYNYTNLTICQGTCDDGTKFRVGVPFESQSEEELIEYIKQNYKTSKEEIEADCGPTEEYLAQEYRVKRVSEYPSFAEQFDLLYHGGYDAWKAKIDEVKNKYPKPE